MGGELVTDAVLPLAIVKPPRHGECALEAIVGTGFIVGTPQRLVTARHVAATSNMIVGMHANNGKWITVGLEDRRDHPTEDVSVYSVAPEMECVEWFQLSGEEHYASGEYAAFGYPDEVYYEQASDVFSPVLPRPDIIYGAGVIRRRFSNQLPNVIGSAFFELSDTLGLGSSGGPVIAKNAHRPGLNVIGIYVAKRTIEIVDRPSRTVAYAVRIAAVASWLREQGLKVN